MCIYNNSLATYSSMATPGRRKSHRMTSLDDQDSSWWTILLVLATILVVAVPPVGGDGTDILGVQQALGAETVMFVDVVDFTCEMIQWQGRDELYVYRPSDSLLVATLLWTGGAAASYSPTENGAFELRLNADQIAGDVWDVSINDNCASSLVGGRLWSRQWYFAAASFGASDATDVSMWAVFLTSLGNKLVETRFEGLAGYVYELGATSDGIASHTPAFKSAPQTGNSIVPEIPLYLKSPDHIPLADTQPTIEFDDVVYVTVGCGDFGSECPTLVNGQIHPRFRFNTDAGGGRYRIVCDTNGDGNLNIVDGSDTVLSGDTVAGANEVLWDGTDSSGVTVANGYYLCEVWVFLAEIHFPMIDVETIYPGMRMFSYFNSVPTPQVMFWNDEDVDAPITMPNGETGATTSGCCGMDSTNDPNAVANVNARAWGNFASGSKGDQAIINTFSFVERSVSVPLNISVGGLSECPQPSVYILNTNVLEKDTGAVSVTIDIVLTSVISSNVDISYATVDGTATAGVDYVTTGGTITLVPDNYCYSVTVDITPDTELEVDEDFYVDIAYAGAGASPIVFRQARSVVTIINDDDNCGVVEPPPHEWPGLVMEVYDEVPGSTVLDLTRSNAYITQSPGCIDPDVTSLEQNPGTGRCGQTQMSSYNYGVAISGWIRVAQTDTYTFQVAGNDAVELWLGADEASLILAAFNTQPNTDESSYGEAASQTSSPMALAANELLFVRVLYKEGDLESPPNDFYSVAWFGTSVSTTAAPLAHAGTYGETFFHNSTSAVGFETDDACCTSRIVETEVRALRTDADPCSGQLFGNVTNTIDLSPQSTGTSVTFDIAETHELEYVTEDLFADLGTADVSGQVFSGRIRQPISTKVRVTAGNDNGFERASDGNVWTNWGFLLMGSWMMAVTFDDVAVPQGATITNAYIELEGDNNGGQDTGTGVIVPIWANNVDNAGTIPTGNSGISSLAPTPTSVNWVDVPEFVYTARYKTPNIGPVVQDVVSRGGWRSGNSMTIIFGFSTGASFRRYVESASDAESAPLLVVEYHTGFTGPREYVGAVYMGDATDGGVGTVNDMSGGFRLSLDLASGGSYTLSLMHSLVGNAIDARNERVTSLLRVNGAYVGNSVGTEGVQMLEELTSSGVSAPTTSSFVLALPAGSNVIEFGGYLSRRRNQNDFAVALFDNVQLTTNDFVSSCGTANLEYNYEWWAPSCSLTAPCSTTQLSSGLCDPVITLFAQNEKCCLELDVLLPKEVPGVRLNTSAVAVMEPASGF
ncbi:PA14 domain-containing protein, partial [Thecamonas trahens ATCC 50062]